MTPGTELVRDASTGFRSHPEKGISGRAASCSFRWPKRMTQVGEK